MENATEALKMAFAIMMFVLALSLSISSFSNANRAVDAIVTLRDRETEYTYVRRAHSSNRRVGVETVIPTLYKAYKENFRVVFLKNDGSPLPLYYQTDSFGNRTKDASGSDIEINYIDLENEIIANPTEAIQHLDVLLNIRQGTSVSNNKYYNQFMADKTQGLYKYLKDKMFEEQLGEYYQEDTSATTSETLDINKTKKRVITYVLQ